MQPLQSTFIYEISLLESLKHRSLWSEKEKAIQQQHVEYLDSLTQQGVVQLAGILDQGLENHTGFVMLNIGSFEEARQIVINDPSIKQGMMTAKLRPLNIYFRDNK